jgi:hypothetical protein
MEVRKWLEENEAPDHMPNIDVIYSAGAKNIDITIPDIEYEDEEEEIDIDEIILDVTLPDDLERAIDVMVAMAYVTLDTSKVKRLSARVIRLTTWSPDNRYVFDYNKVWSKPGTEEEE